MALRDLLQSIGGRGEQQRILTVPDVAAIEISTASLTPNELYVYLLIFPRACAYRC
jgi:hypothetical protein